MAVCAEREAPKVPSRKRAPKASLTITVGSQGHVGRGRKAPVGRIQPRKTVKLAGRLEQVAVHKDDRCFLRSETGRPDHTHGPIVQKPKAPSNEGRLFGDAESLVLTFHRRNSKEGAQIPRVKPLKTNKTFVALALHICEISNTPHDRKLLYVDNSVQARELKYPSSWPPIKVLSCSKSPPMTPQVVNWGCLPKSESSNGI